jgi:hypothetical protein
VRRRGYRTAADARLSCRQREVEQAQQHGQVAVIQDDVTQVD